MKIIWRDRLARETESESLLCMNVPWREGRIMVDALNDHATANDRWELVPDDYVLYRHKICRHEYFVQLAAIWRDYLTARNIGGYSMTQRDADIKALQARWKPGATIVEAYHAAPRPTKPIIDLKAMGLLP